MTEKAHAAPFQNTCVSSRVRLARNYADIPFMPQITAEWAEETIRRADEAILNASDATAYKGVRIRDLAENERQELLDHRKISYDLLKYPDYAAALFSSGNTVTVMVNEEDHLRIQASLPGLQLQRAQEIANHADDELGVHGAYAFDPQLGYLTSSPANAGTGMRASVVLHLPALRAAGQIAATSQAMGKLGITLRGLYGTGGDAPGDLFLLANQSTLGRSEEDIISALEDAAIQVGDHEQNLRETLHERDALLMEDKILRSAAILQAARMLRLIEFMHFMSDLRLGSAMGILPAPIGEIDALVMDLQNASIRTGIRENINDRDVLCIRAEKVRQKIAEWAN